MSDLLDARLDKIDASHAQLHNLIFEIEQILETLVTNDTQLLEALAQMLASVPQMQTRNEQSQIKLAEEIRHEIRLFTELIKKNAAQTGAEPAILIQADAFSAANPEVTLLQYLYSFLSDPVALDIGANVGAVSERLLQAGYEVYAFEPNPPVFEALQKNFAGKDRLHLFQLALGSANETADLHVAVDSTGGNKYGDPTLFSSLVAHPMPEDLPFTQTVPVLVRTLESLRRSGEIPARAGLVKIDTEGFDLEVIRGFGGYPCPVVMTEFWDASHAFGRSGNGRLEAVAREMKNLGYEWYIVIYHLEEAAKISYYCNRFQTVPNSWGNAIFFRDHAIFLHAFHWCESTLVPTVHR